MVSTNDHFTFILCHVSIPLVLILLDIKASIKATDGILTHFFAMTRYRYGPPPYEETYHGVSSIGRSNTQIPLPTYAGSSPHAASGGLHAPDDGDHMTGDRSHLSSLSPYQGDSGFSRRPGHIPDYPGGVDRGVGPSISIASGLRVTWRSTGEPSHNPSFSGRSLSLSRTPTPYPFRSRPMPPPSFRDHSSVASFWDRSGITRRFTPAAAPIAFRQAKPRRLYAGTFLYGACALTLHYFIANRVHMLLAPEDPANGKLVLHYIAFLLQGIMTTYAAFLNAFPYPKAVLLFSKMGWTGHGAQLLACSVFPDGLDRGIYILLHVLLALLTAGGVGFCMFFRVKIIKWGLIEGRSGAV